MARPANPNSKRQRGFTILDSMKGIKRAAAIIFLKENLGIGNRYAETIYASHRTLAKSNGSMQKAYSVQCLHAGKTVEPFMRVENTFTLPEGTYETPTAAKDAYIKLLSAKLKSVEEL